MADTFRCPDCNERTKIPIKRYHRRKKGHIKHLWCWRCKRVTPQTRLMTDAQATL